MGQELTMYRPWQTEKLGLVVAVALGALGILLAIAAVIGVAVLFDVIAEAVR